jgi:hypothetical protein
LFFEIPCDGELLCEETLQLSNQIENSAGAMTYDERRRNGSQNP